MASPSLTPQLMSSLQTTKSLTPQSGWLHAFLATQRPTTPVSALLSTASFRLFASDITTSLLVSPTTCFPLDILDASIKERQLQGSVVVQVLEVEDIGQSRWEQVEALEATERGEGTRGREIIRVIAGEQDDESSGPGGRINSIGPHKLVLQDASGARVFAMEVTNVNGVGLGMNIGCKLVLRDVVVARAVVLLEPRSCTILGGKIEALDTEWKAGRKDRLKRAAERSNEE